MPFKYIARKNPKSGDCEVLKIQVKAKKTIPKLKKQDEALLSTINTNDEKRKIQNIYLTKLKKAKESSNDTVVDYINLFTKNLAKIKPTIKTGIDPVVKAVVDANVAKDKADKAIKKEKEKLTEVEEDMTSMAAILEVEHEMKKDEEEDPLGDFLQAYDSRRKSKSSTTVMTPIGPVTGKGLTKFNEDEGLWNEQIDKMFRGDDRYLGCIASDKVMGLHDKYKGKPFGYVMNLDKTDEPGSHWVSVYVDPINEKEIDYFDPFGRDPSNSWLQQMQHFTRDFPYLLKLKINKVPNQDISSGNCGFISSWFLIQRLNGINFKDATGFDEPIIKSNAEMSENKMKQFKRVFNYI